VHVHERIVVRGNCEDAVTLVNLSAKFGGCAGYQRFDDGIAFLDAKECADSHRRLSPNGRDCCSSVARVGKLVRPPQRGFSVPPAPAGKDGVDKFAAISLGELVCQGKGGGWIR